MCKDLWIIDYESCFNDYGDHVERFGEEEARQRFRASLKALGFDPHEINDHLNDLTS